MSKEKLAIEITEVDCIEIDNMYLTKAGENEVLEQLASNSTSSNEQYTGLQEEPSAQSIKVSDIWSTDLLDPGVRCPKGLFGKALSRHDDLSRADRTND